MFQNKKSTQEIFYELLIGDNDFAEVTVSQNQINFFKH